MCGIVGVIDFDGPGATPSLLSGMLAPIRHRGPDADGVYLAGPAGLGHTRLSIIDVDGGRQPMPNEDRSVWVTFNGEIFNYIELREMLRRKGHRFATRSDTEVIVHLYEEYGEDCVEHFNGQWAFAVWDAGRRTLLLSRDRMGVRPLYYTTAGGKFLFASEVKALFAHPDVERELDPVALDQLFTFWTPLPPRTVFRGISELPPGHNLSLRRSGLRVSRFWQLGYDPQPQPATTRQWSEPLRELLADAAQLRLRSDVPVGVYLSGGLDSAVTAALVKQCTGEAPRSFSVCFDDAEYDESAHQDRVARALGTDHVAIRCSGDDIGRVFPDVIRHTERPVLRTAPAPLYLLSRLVHDEGYKVVLTGEGADEMLGGYDIFKEAKIRRFCAADPQSAFRAMLLKKLYPYMPGVQAQSVAYRRAFFHAGREELQHPFFSHLPRWELTSRLKVFFSPEFRRRLADYDPFAELLDSLPGEYGKWPPFCQAQYLEATILMPGYILSSQGDRVAMAHSVEGRFPFLDHRLAEFAGRLPVRTKMKGLREKHVLRAAAAELLPPEILRRTKQPYRAPDAQSFIDGNSGAFRHDYVAELLSPERIADGGVFRPAAVEQLVRKARSGRMIGVKDNMALVGILSTQLVIEHYVRQPAAPLSPTPATSAPGTVTAGTAGQAAS